MDWRKRQRVPDENVLNAASQYEAARRLLAELPPGSGVVLPLMNTAAVSIELHLKSLSAEMVHTPEGSIPGLMLVTAAPAVKCHALQELFDLIPEETRASLDKAFRTAFPTMTDPSARDVLARFEGLFADSRYPFEKGVRLDAYPLDLLMRFSAFLADFVAEMPPREWIEW